MKRWKVFKKGLTSNNGVVHWQIGEWQKHEVGLEMCLSGFHCSKRIINAMQYTNAEEIALVEVKGKRLAQADKECWEQMRILKVYDWTKEDSVSLAIFAAELVLKNFEAFYPNDNRPRQAIEAAKAWQKEKTASAARSAAESAASAARSAAESAARSAASAASAARSAAESAAWSAASAARSAANFNKCEKFILGKLKGRD